MITRIEIEIVELHQFFEDWYNHQMIASDKNFARCADALASNFSTIFPNRERVLRQPLLDKIRKAHHSHTSMRIWIDKVQVLTQIRGLILAIYEEWQEIEGTGTARINSHHLNQKSVLK